MSKFHSSILLDALDLCTDNVFVMLEGDVNFIQEYIPKGVLSNVVIGDSNNQLVVVEGKKSGRGYGCDVLLSIMLLAV